MNKILLSVFCGLIFASGARGEAGVLAGRDAFRAYKHDALRAAGLQEQKFATKQMLRAPVTDTPCAMIEKAGEPMVRASVQDVTTEVMEKKFAPKSSCDVFDSDENFNLGDILSMFAQQQGEVTNEAVPLPFPKDAAEEMVTNKVNQVITQPELLKTIESVEFLQKKSDKEEAKFNQVQLPFNPQMNTVRAFSDFETSMPQPAYLKPKICIAINIGDFVMIGGDDFDENSRAVGEVWYKAFQRTVDYTWFGGNRITLSEQYESEVVDLSVLQEWSLNHGWIDGMKVVYFI